ncbi:MAG: hypothetical protein IJS02_00310 [Bacteroidales bacterium]|nr:hypothetical protein [Bacteroidales bacterium]
MKYLIRSAKYLLYFVILFFVIVLVISFMNHQDITDFQSLFIDGALAKISIIFVVIAAVYPLFGFKKNRLNIDDDFENYYETIVETMENYGYELSIKDETKLVFRASKPSIRFARMWEDAITFCITEDPKVIDVDGPYKDTVRVVRAISYNYRMEHRTGEEDGQ